MCLVCVFSYYRGACGVLCGERPVHSSFFFLTCVQGGDAASRLSKRTRILHTPTSNGAMYWRTWRLVSFFLSSLLLHYLYTLQKRPTLPNFYLLIITIHTPAAAQTHRCCPRPSPPPPEPPSSPPSPSARPVKEGPSRLPPPPRAPPAPAPATPSTTPPTPSPLPPPPSPPSAARHGWTSAAHSVHPPRSKTRPRAAARSSSSSSSPRPPTRPKTPAGPAGTGGAAPAPSPILPSLPLPPSPSLHRCAGRKGGRRCW